MRRFPWLHPIAAMFAALALLAWPAASQAQDTAPGDVSGSGAEVGEGGATTLGEFNDDEADREMNALDELVFKLWQGGVIVVVQILLSVFGFGIALERFVSLRRDKLVPTALVVEADELWNQGKYDELIKRAKADGSLLGRVLVAIVRHRKADHATISAVAGDVTSRELRRHFQRLFPIALVATLEPLLGLLGTIVGMIDAFDTVARAGSMGDASILADDIAKALVTTAVGLIIAIPAVFVYQSLKSKIGFASATLDEEVSGLISDWIVLKGHHEPALADGTAAEPEPSEPEAEAATDAQEGAEP